MPRGGADRRWPRVARSLDLGRSLVPEDLVGRARSAEESEDRPLHGAVQHVGEQRREDELFASHEQQHDDAGDDERPDDLPNRC